MEEKRINDIGIMRRSQLTKATYKVVSRKGYYNFTIKDIAKEAGLSAGLVHYLFQGQAGPAPEFIKGNEPEYTRLP